MNTTRIIAISAFSLFAAVGAHADEADSSQFSIQAGASRARAEVQAEARTPIKISNGSTGVHAPGSMAVSRSEVRAEAATALREGKISSGEIGTVM